MSNSTLSRIKTKVRRLSGSPSTSQLSESDLEDYINTFLELDFPSHLKIWNLHTTLDFYTVPNEDEYPFNTDLYHAVLPPVYIDGYQSNYTQSRNEMFNQYPKLMNQYTGPSGDGSAGPYSFTLPNTPVLRRDFQVSVTDSVGVTHTAYDVPVANSETLGNLVDSIDDMTVLGTINYVTGSVTVTWPQTIDANQTNIARYVVYQGSRPSMILFFQDYFLLRPVPDKVYKVSVEVYSKPMQLLSANNNDGENTLDVNQWWQYIAFGAAIKVLQDRQDMESIQNIMPFFKEQENLILYRTATQQAPERTATIYTDQMSYGGRNFWGQ